MILIARIVSIPNFSWAIDTFKSPGPGVLQHVSAITVPILEVTFKAYLRLSHIPSLRKEVTVTCIPKAGKPSHSLPEDYRLISPSSFLPNFVEKIIYVAIKCLIPTNWISSAQHAYMKGKSVEIG